MSHTVVLDLPVDVLSPEPIGSQGSFAVDKSVDESEEAELRGYGAKASLQLPVAEQEARQPRREAPSKPLTARNELEIAAEAARKRHGADAPPSSWGGLVTSSAPQGGAAGAVSVPDDRIERLSAKSLSVPAYAYGHLTVVPVSTRDEFRAVTDFLHARMKSAQDKAVIVTPKRMHVNVAPEITKRLANWGVIIVNGDEEDPVRGARKFISDFAARRQQTLKNFNVFMRHA